MTHNIYTIRDRVAERAGPPFTAVNHAVAAREYRRLLSKQPNLEDFQLLWLGSFDDVEATVSTEGVDGQLDVTPPVEAPTPLN